MASASRAFGNRWQTQPRRNLERPSARTDGLFHFRTFHQNTSGRVPSDFDFYSGSRRARAISAIRQLLSPRQKEPKHDHDDGDAECQERIARGIRIIVPGTPPRTAIGVIRELELVVWHGRKVSMISTLNCSRLRKVPMQRVRKTRPVPALQQALSDF